MAWTLERRFETAHGAVAWDVMGRGDPLVVIHGTPFSSFAWRRIAPVLAEAFRVGRPPVPAVA